jgi:hypothetical protein
MPRRFAIAAGPNSARSLPVISADPASPVVIRAASRNPVILDRYRGQICRLNSLPGNKPNTGLWARCHALDWRTCGGKARAVELHRAVLLGDQAEAKRKLGYNCADVRRELPGRDLGCYCGLDEPCHADTLLEIANSDVSRPD